MLTSLVARRLAAFALVASVAAPAAAHAEAPADDGVSFVVLRENATGSASAAQTYIDQLIEAIAKSVGWDNASGKYVTRRSAAERFIGETSPEFGIVSLSAYLALKSKHKFTALGMADIQNGGGHQFFVVSKEQVSLSACKGKTLGTNHGDATFIDKVVSGDDFDLADFKVEDTRRPVKTLKSVIEGDVDCAFIDDAQLMELQHLEGGLDVHPVWSSEALPPMVVVALPTAEASASKAFKASLNDLCTKEGKAACEATSMHLVSADDGTFAKYAKAYGG